MKHLAPYLAGDDPPSAWASLSMIVSRAALVSAAIRRLVKHLAPYLAPYLGCTLWGAPYGGSSLFRSVSTCEALGTSFGGTPGRSVMPFELTPTSEALLGQLVQESWG